VTQKKDNMMKKRKIGAGLSACGKRLGKLIAVAAAILAGATALPAAEKEDSLPGMGVQPAEYFYTGKPYDSDTGSYTFKYRNYDPELNRWTTSDPSGFPDGANNSRYAPTPTTGIDWQGLVVINSIQEALSYWGRSGGSSSDTVQAGSSIIDAIKSSSGYNDLIYRIQSGRIQPELLNVNSNASSGDLTNGPHVGPADIGFVDLVIGRSSISYFDSSTWSALTGFYNNGDSWGRDLKATTTMNADFYDVFDFTSQANDSWWMNLLEETIPGWIAGPGTPFNIDGLFDDSFDTHAWQYE